MILGDMFPGNPVPHIREGLGIKAGFSGELHEGFPSCEFEAIANNEFWGEFCATVFLPDRIATALAISVTHILQHCAKPQMGGVDASRIIASVHHDIAVAGRYFHTVMQFVGEVMRKSFAGVAAINMDSAVAAFSAFAPQPLPALVWFPDDELFAESLFKGAVRRHLATIGQPAPRVNRRSFRG